MATQVQILRGTTTQNDNFLGEQGVITYDIQKKQLRVHDGITTGGVGVVDVLVQFQAPTALNNYTWVRKYASGWVEQGGAFATVDTQYHTETVVLPVEMADATYYCNVNSASTGSAYMPLIETKSATGFTAYNVVNNAAYAATWEVRGMAA